MVKPLHKGGENKTVNNYRPISILCVASKLIERHVYSSLYKYFVNNDLFCNNQSGFCKNYSCHTCLTNIVECWLSAMNKGHIVGSVKLDFSKAFDVLDHNILLQKLECYGCDNLSLDWFGSYLGQRSQSVKLQDTLSDSMPLKCGVAQGFILGPLLFVIFTNDMHLHVLNSSLDSYADDSNVSKSGRFLQDLVTGLQEDLNTITVMLVCSLQKQDTIDTNELLLSVNNQVLKVVTCQKILGINIDSTLSFEPRIESMCTTISQLLGLLWRVKPFLDKKAKEMFYTSIIMAKLRYCFTVWENGPKYLMQRLYRLQKRAARIVLDCDINVPTEVLFDKLGWMTVDELLFYEKCIFMFKVHRGLCAEYLLELFSHVNINTIYNYVHLILTISRSLNLILKSIRKVLLILDLFYGIVFQKC